MALTGRPGESPIRILAATEVHVFSPDNERRRRRRRRRRRKGYSKLMQ